MGKTLSFLTWRESRQKMLTRKTQELLDEPDLHKLLELLKNHSKFLYKVRETG